MSTELVIKPEVRSLVEEVDIEDGDDETDSSGEFSSIILIPDSTAGTHAIKVAVGSSEVEAEFTVEPEMALDMTSGEVGAEVTVAVPASIGGAMW